VSHRDIEEEERGLGRPLEVRNYHTRRLNKGAVWGFCGKPMGLGDGSQYP
jgi:hypothetical protein